MDALTAASDLGCISFSYPNLWIRTMWSLNVIVILHIAVGTHIKVIENSMQWWKVRHMRVCWYGISFWAIVEFYILFTSVGNLYTFYIYAAWNRFSFCARLSAAKLRRFLDILNQPQSILWKEGRKCTCTSLCSCPSFPSTSWRSRWPPLRIRSRTSTGITGSK